MVHRIVSAIAFSAAFLGAMGNGKFGIPVVELPLGELALESLNASGHGRILDGVFFFFLTGFYWLCGPKKITLKAACLH